MIKSIRKIEQINKFSWALLLIINAHIYIYIYNNLKMIKTQIKKYNISYM